VVFFVTQKAQKAQKAIRLIRAIRCSASYFLTSYFFFNI